MTASPQSPSFAVDVVEGNVGRALVVRLAGPHDVLSWAIVNGGRRAADTIVWREVRLDELGPTSDPAALLTATLSELAAPGAVGLLTARDVRRYEVARAEREGVAADCLLYRLPSAPGLVAALRARGILVRHCASFGLPQHVRIGVRDESEQEALARLWPRP